jgi:diguanylate cyclase (GGDEF)-like protein
MTLSRQLMLSGMLLLLILFIGMITYVVKNTEVFVSQQLSSHSQDTATALGVTLTFTMKSNDTVTASRIVDAIWDRGYYSKIEVQSLNGAPIVQRTASIKVFGVPEWFINLIALNTQPEEARIMDGWQQVGKVVVESNPGFAYQQIWLTFTESLKWLLLTSVLAVLMGGMLLYIILKPLRAISDQALAICNQQFPIQKSLPWTIDLRQVVEAMNNMSGRLKKLFEEQAEVSERLREQAYKDPITQLANRRYFDLQLDFLLQDKEKAMDGVLLLVEISGFKEYNEKFGYQEGDRLLVNVAHTIQEISKPYENAIVTHAKGASFFIILSGRAKLVGESIADKICIAFREYSFKNITPIKSIGNVGVALFKPGDQKRDVISRVDMALRGAQSQGENSWHSVDVGSQQTHTATDWASIFETVLKNNQFVLHFQKTLLWSDNRSDQSTLYETLMRIYADDKNAIINAGVFMPMAEQLEQMVSLDQLMIENVINRILKGSESVLYFVNISPSTIDNPVFKKWILDKVQQLGKRINQLAIELPEHAVISRSEKVRTFYREFSNLGGRTSIDHYGKSFSSFSYLFNLKLNYLKIDGGFIRNINTHEENQFLIRSLVEIAHSLDIFIIAESVETEEEFVALKQLNVDGVQGYYVGKPTDMGV